MKNLHFLILLVLISTLSINTLASYQPDTFDMSNTRSKAMGGVGVALLDDATAMRLNPAALNQINTVSVALEGALDHLSLDASKRMIDFIFDRSGAFEIEEAFKSRTHGFVGFSTNRFGLGLMAFFSVNKQGDKVKISNLNTSNVALALPLGIFSQILDRFYVGANIKLHHPIVEEVDLSVEPFTQEKHRGNGQGFDLGLLVDLGRVRLGLSAKDLSSTISFDGVSEPIEIVPHFNFGTAIDLFHNRAPGISLIAIDYTDLYLTKGDLSGVLRVGAEQTLFKSITLRTGVVMTDLLQDTRNLEYSSGLGVKLGPVVLDAAVMTSDFSKENLKGSLGFEIRL
ncbi:MAG: hypothetical protein PHD88_06760 [Firmicutes bacterium]|nr:hypothetical protein [Bacillota bacterium]MDD4694081.1 hypothetical protein [Bacillota bacterium]